jgi:hypothetical protein
VKVRYEQGLNSRQGAEPQRLRSVYAPPCTLASHPTKSRSREVGKGRNCETFKIKWVSSKPGSHFVSSKPNTYRRWNLKSRYSLLLLVLLIVLGACNSGGNTNPPASTCPTPAVLDNSECKLDTLTIGD